MEVQKHPHHVTHKKKWGEYILEFLMLFLAVFLGFVAENFREHNIEHKRVRQYAVLLIGDLQSDTAFFNKENIRWLDRQNHFDSLINLLIQPAAASDKRILKELLSINYVSDAKMNMSTYNQMKTSGSLRYIHNFDLMTALEDYYEVQIPRVIEASQSTMRFFDNHIKAFFIEHLRNQDMKSDMDTMKNWNPVILGRNREGDQRLSNIVDMSKTQLGIANRFYNSANTKAGKLIDLIKKQYHLE